MKYGNLFFIVMIGINLALITLLMVYPFEGWMKKGVQVLIVIVTFTLFRTYIKERQMISDKKNGDNK